MCGIGKVATAHERGGRACMVADALVRSIMHEFSERKLLSPATGRSAISNVVTQLRQGGIRNRD